MNSSLYLLINVFLIKNIVFFFIKIGEKKNLILKSLLTFGIEQKVKKAGVTLPYRNYNIQLSTSL